MTVQNELNQQDILFLCYSPIDKEKVYELYNHLKNDGINVWIDQQSLLPGQNRKSEVANIIAKSYAIIVCLSKNSIQEEGEIQADIRVAIEAAKNKPEGIIFMIPVKLDACQLPPSLSQYHPANLYEDDGYYKLLQSLRIQKKYCHQSYYQLQRMNRIGIQLEKWKKRR
jgi:hypothetical protein